MEDEAIQSALLGIVSGIWIWLIVEVIREANLSHLGGFSTLVSSVVLGISVAYMAYSYAKRGVVQFSFVRGITFALSVILIVMGVLIIIF